MPDKVKSPKSSADMLTWQYKTLLGECQQIELHETGDCPCILNTLEPQERCLGKHLLNISTLAAETANMDSANKEWLEKLAKEADEKHGQFIEFIHHTGDLPPLTDWMRGWRKKHLEPTYYGEGDGKKKAKMKEIDLIEIVARMQEPKIHVAGKCSPDKSCSFTVSSTEKVSIPAGSIRQLPRTIEEVLKLVSEKKISASDKTFAYGATGINRYDFQYKIVDGDKLIVSHDPYTFVPNPNYPQELQPRKRERKSPQLQVQNIAQNLNPDVLLVDFRSTDRGAPIIGSDMVVESGNGRTMGLILASKDVPERFEAYKTALKSIAPAYALDPADVEKFKVPVLVRVRLTETDRKAFAEDCNAPVALEQSAIEKARTDAEKITPAMIQALEVGENENIEDALRSPRNKQFVSSFLAKLPGNEQAKLVDSSGIFNQDGVRRTTLAVFLATFRSDVGLQLAEAWFESTDANVKNCLNGIAGALGILAQAEALSISGEREKEYSIGDDLAKAVTVFSRIKKTPDMTVAKYLAQIPLTERELSPFQEKILSTIDANSRSGKKIAAILISYSQKVIDSPPPGQVSFMAMEKATKDQLFDAAANFAANMSEVETNKLTVDELSKFTFEGIKQLAISKALDISQTQGVARNRDLEYRHAKILALDRNGIEHNYKVQVSSNNEVSITDLGKSREQSTREYLGEWVSLSPAIRDEVERLWPNLNLVQKVIMGNLYAGKPVGVLSIQAVVGGAARNVFQAEYPTINTTDKVIEWMKIRGQQLVEPQAIVPVTSSQPTTSSSKEPWQMTRSEFFALGKQEAELEKKGLAPAYAGAFDTVHHREAIKKALAEGRNIPREVLADYPDLVTTPFTTKDDWNTPKEEPIKTTMRAIWPPHGISAGPYSTRTDFEPLPVIEPRIVQPVQARLFERRKARMADSLYSGWDLLKGRIEMCNIDGEEADRIMNWGPLRDFIMFAVGGIGRVRVCQTGMVPGAYQITLTDVKDPALAVKIANKIPRARRVYTQDDSIVYEVLVPESHVGGELEWGKQEVQDIRRGEKGEQVAMMFEGKPIVLGLRKSMLEELIAAKTYRERMKDADEKTANVYQHVINEEYEHYQLFLKRLFEIEPDAKLEEKKTPKEQIGFDFTKSYDLPLVPSKVEPWQWTLDEMKKAVMAGEYDFRLLGIGERKASMLVEILNNDKAANSDNSYISQKMFDNAVSSQHEAIVLEAYLAKQPVPINVLAFYADDFRPEEAKRIREEFAATQNTCPPVCPIVSSGNIEKSTWPGAAPGFEPFDFQKEGIAWLKGRPFALLADEQGLGKTNQAIYWGVDYKPVLVVVPASLTLNWEREITKRWRVNDTAVVLDGKMKLPAKLPDYTVMSYGQLPRYADEIKRAGFKAIIVDEAHNVKNLDAQRTKNLLELVDPEKPIDGQKIIPNRLAVTGTPMLNRPIELFALFVFLGVETRKHYRRFLEEYTEHKEYKGRVQFTGTRNLRQLNEILKGFMLRRKKADVLKQLPPKTNTPLFVPITNAEEYKEAERNFLKWLRETKGQEAADRAAGAEIIAKLNALRLLAAKGKVQPVADWLKPCYQGAGKVIVLSSFKEPLEALAKLKKTDVVYTGELNVEQRQKLVDEFQTKGDRCYFMGTIGAAGVGITLTAANRVAFLDLPWTPGGKAQAEDRAHRIGQTKPVEIVNVLARGTIDERMLKILEDKEFVISQAIDGKTKEAAASGSIAKNLLSSYISESEGFAPAMVNEVEQYEGDNKDPDVVSVDESEIERIAGVQETTGTVKVSGNCAGAVDDCKFKVSVVGKQATGGGYGGLVKAIKSVSDGSGRVFTLKKSGTKVPVSETKAPDSETKEVIEAMKVAKLVK